MSIEVILNDPNISVIGPPASIDVQLDIGPTGQRGSQIYMGTLDPNSSPPTSSPLSNDIFFRQTVVNQVDIYQYLSDGVGGFQWEKVMTLTGYNVT